MTNKVKVSSQTENEIVVLQAEYISVLEKYKGCRGELEMSKSLRAYADTLLDKKWELEARLSQLDINFKKVSTSSL